MGGDLTGADLTGAMWPAAGGLTVPGAALLWLDGDQTTCAQVLRLTAEQADTSLTLNSAASFR